MPKTFKDIVSLAFLILGIGVAINLLLLQSAPRTPAAKRAAERDQQRLVMERERSLSLSALVKDGARPTSPRSAPMPAAVSLPGEPATADTVRAVQRELQLLGYETGSPSASPTLVLRAAILAYEHDRGLGATGEPSEALLKALLLGTPAIAASPPTQAPGTSPQHRVEVERVVRTVQQSLSALGYNPGKANGVVGEDTERAIREFEGDHGMAETGRVSGRLIARLGRQMSDNKLLSGR